ncbi:MAG: zinc ribbon domain-containing protein [Burkholderiaceae bacterium]|nr:zinc ribbon domain-containing protein [Burkholderiaceae bacterium]
MGILDRLLGGHRGGGHHGGGHHGGGYGAPPAGGYGNPSPAPPPVVNGVSCPSCRSINSPGARFCQQCGTSMAPAACAQCGTTLQAGARFCAQCGKTVG